MWKLDTRSGPVAVRISPSSPQSTWAWAPGRTSKRRWNPAGSASASVRRARYARRVVREVALDGPPVIAGLPGDLRPGGPGLGQRLERAQFHPVLLREDHELPSSDLAGWSLPAGGLPSRRADPTARPRRPTRQAVRRTTYQGVRGQPMRRSSFQVWPGWSAPVNLSEAGFLGNHCVVAVSSFGSLIHTAVGSAGGVGGLRTKRSGCSA